MLLIVYVDGKYGEKMDPIYRTKISDKFHSTDVTYTKMEILLSFKRTHLEGKRSVALLIYPKVNDTLALDAGVT